MMRMAEASPALINVMPCGRWSALHQAAEKGDAQAVGDLVGCDVGVYVGFDEGSKLGCALGADVGVYEGLLIGTAEGDGVAWHDLNHRIDGKRFESAYAL